MAKVPIIQEQVIINGFQIDCVLAVILGLELKIHLTLLCEEETILEIKLAHIQDLKR